MLDDLKYIHQRDKSDALGIAEKQPDQLLQKFDITPAYTPDHVYNVVFSGMGGSALPALLAGITLTLVMLIGFSSMAGVIGGGGLGDLAIRYGYQRFNNQIMVATVVVLVILVQGVQSLGDRLVRSLAHRR